MREQTEWDPAIASTVANHYIEMEDFHREQASRLAAVIEEIIHIVGFEAGPPYEEPLFEGLYSVPRLLAHIRAGRKP